MKIKLKYLFVKLFVGPLYVHFKCLVYIGWEALYIMSLYVMYFFIGKHHMSDVIR